MTEHADPGSGRGSLLRTDERCAGILCLGPYRVLGLAVGASPSLALAPSMLYKDGQEDGFL